MLGISFIEFTIGNSNTVVFQKVSQVGMTSQKGCTPAGPVQLAGRSTEEQLFTVYTNLVWISWVWEFLSFLDIESFACFLSLVNFICWFLCGLYSTWDVFHNRILPPNSGMQQQQWQWFRWPQHTPHQECYRKVVHSWHWDFPSSMWWLLGVSSVRHTQCLQYSSASVYIFFFLLSQIALKLSPLLSRRVAWHWNSSW